MGVTFDEAKQAAEEYRQKQNGPAWQKIEAYFFAIRPSDGARRKALEWVRENMVIKRTRRAGDLKWIRSIIRQCRAAEVPCLIKQLGANPVGLHIAPGGRPEVSIVANSSFKLKDPKGGDPEEWPEDLRVREFPES